MPKLFFDPNSTANSQFYFTKKPKCSSSVPLHISQGHSRRWRSRNQKCGSQFFVETPHRRRFHYGTFIAPLYFGGWKVKGQSQGRECKNGEFHHKQFDLPQVKNKVLLSSPQSPQCMLEVQQSKFKSKTWKCQNRNNSSATDRWTMSTSNIYLALKVGQRKSNAWNKNSD